MRRREPELQSFQTGPLALTLLMLKPLTTKGMQYHEGKTVAQLLRACSFPLWAFVSCVVNASRNRYLSSRAPGEDAVQSRQNQLMEIKRTISRIAYRIEPNLKAASSAAAAILTCRRWKLPVASNWSSKFKQKLPPRWKANFPA